MLNKIFAYATVKIWKIKEAIKDFWEEEQGASQVLEIVLVLVIVVGLALVFRKQIGTLVGKLWSSINSATGDFNPTNIQDEIDTGG